MFMCKRLYFLIATFVLMVSAAVAQVTTSGMSGKITANNEVVIGAAVEAIHTPSGTRYVGVTNSKGMYLVAHEPFESKEAAIRKESDIFSDFINVEIAMKRQNVADTDQGVEIRESIRQLEDLLRAYEEGILVEKGV